MTRPHRVPVTCAIVAACAAALLGPSCIQHQVPGEVPMPVVPAERSAVLPLTPGDVRTTVTQREGGRADEVVIASSGSGEVDIAARLNATLDKADRASGGPLLGPTRVKELLRSDPHAAEYAACLDDPGHPDEPWKAPLRARLAQRLGADRVLRILPVVQYHQVAPDQGSGASVIKTRGEATVSILELDLRTGQRRELTSATVEFSSSAGFVGIAGYNAGIIVPYAVGKSAEWAVDKAARQAIAEFTTWQPATNGDKP